MINKIIYMRTLWTPIYVRALVVIAILKFFCALAMLKTRLELAFVAIS
jgi:hypothetical protein